MNPSVLERPVRQHGTFVLPEIASDVPVILGSKHLPEMLLAKFSLAAERAGMQYPGGKYTNLEDVVAKQLQGWIEQNVSKDALELMAGSPSITASDSGLSFFMNAESSLRTFRLKPVVESLEAVKPGLGWFVSDVIASSSGKGMNVYGPSLIGCRAEGFFYGETSDEGLARAIASENGEQEPETDEEVKTVLQDNAENWPFYPSHVLEDVEGHAHLLGWDAKDGKKRSQYLTVKSVQRALKKLDMAPNLRACVEQAVQLKLAYDRDKDHDYAWCYDDDAEPIGGVFFLAWDSPDILYEMVEHEETELLNGGTGTDCLMRLHISSDAVEGDFDQLARKIRVYFEMWSALGKLMRHFYEEGNQDGN